MSNTVPLVSLRIATSDDTATLSNLFELYAHDLSDVFQLDLGTDGRFGYAKLPLYWSEPDDRYPFFICCGAQLAGFALITRGSPAADNPEVFDVAEFFVARRYRRHGVGQQAAFMLWNRFCRRWTVRVSEANVGACKFWSRTIGTYTNAAFKETMQPGALHDWRIFQFDSLQRDNSL